MIKIPYIKFRIRKFLANLFIGLLAFFFACTAALFIWVNTGPRSINSLTPYIESALSSPATGYTVKIEDSSIRWDSLDNPLGINIKNVEVINSRNNVIAYFPEIIIKIYLHKLLLGKFDVNSLELLHPSATLLQNNDGTISLGLNDKEVQADNSAPAIFPLITSDGDANPMQHLKSLTVRNGIFSIKNKVSGIIMQSTDTSVQINRKHGITSGKFSMPVLFNNKLSEISADFSMEKPGNTLSANIVYKNIPTSALHNLFPAKEWLAGINLPLSGTIQVSRDLDANINKLDFVLESGQGSVTYPAQFSDPLNMQAIKISGSVTDKLNNLNIKQGKILIIGHDSKTIDLSFNGNARKLVDDYAIDGHAETANIPINDVHRYWPVGLSPHSRKWVTTHVSKGMVTKANVDLHFKPGDIKLKDTPEEDVASTIAIKNASIKYLPDHPPVDDINAVIKFTGKSMNAAISSAKYMSGGQITSATVKMPDMYPDDVRMFIDMDINAPATDVAAFMALPKVEKAEKLGITKDISGQTSGNAKFNFIAFSEHDNEKNSNSGDIKYDVSAKLSDVSQNNFLGKHDVEKANMNININNKGIKTSGNAVINKVPMSVDLSSSFEKNRETAYIIKCDMPVEAMHRFKMPELDFARGIIGVTAKFTESGQADNTQATLDLVNTAILMPEHGFSKRSGEQATLELDADKMQSGNTFVKSFTLRGNNVMVSGNAEFDKAKGDFSAITFDKLHFGNNDASHLEYRKVPGGIKLSAIANSIDLSPYLDEKNAKKDQGYDINIKAGRVVFGDKKELKSASIQAECPKICKSANITAKLSDGTPFTYIINGGKLRAASDNAGELVRILGISDTIEGGKLLLTAAYNGSNLEGALEIKDYTLKKAPLLTKMLTIASLTGFLDTLAGNGIAFSRLYAPFTYRDGIIVLKDAKTHGSALGLTAGGTIDRNKSSIDINGVLIPSYTMNSMIGNVPVIGDLLLGGSGKGIIGMNYGMKGDIRDPAVTVNPLSVFTPGFLRGIFDIFDQPAPDIDKIAAQSKAGKKTEKEKEKKTGNSLPPIDMLRH